MASAHPPIGSIFLLSLLLLIWPCTADFGCPPPPGDLYGSKTRRKARDDTADDHSPMAHHITTNGTLSPKSYALSVQSDFDIDKLPTEWARTQKNEPWPPLRCPGGVDHAKRWVTYCFVDDKAADNLVEILLHAIARWRPATVYSTFNIAPEIRCYDWATKLWSFKCTCTDEFQYALRISDGRTVKDDAFANTGYTSIIPFEDTIAFHHKHEDGQKWSDAYKLQVRISGMTHELGHVIGLLHEHQRPDASIYVEVQCRNIDEYVDAVDKAKEEIRERVFDQDSTFEERMKKM